VGPTFRAINSAERLSGRFPVRYFDENRAPAPPHSAADDRNRWVECIAAPGMWQNPIISM
jgi:hypothetical protein